EELKFYDRNHHTQCRPGAGCFQSEPQRNTTTPPRPPRGIRARGCCRAVASVLPVSNNDVAESLRGGPEPVGPDPAARDREQPKSSGGGCKTHRRRGAYRSRTRAREGRERTD